MKRICIAILALVSALSINSQVRLPAIFSSNMVLQQKDSVKLWGWADPMEKIAITTSWNNRTDTAVTKSNAKWELTVMTPSAGGPYRITFKGYRTVSLENVMIGEVWLCSGQSNMQWNYYGGVKDIDAELKLSAQENIRFFHVPKSASDDLQDDTQASWSVCDSNSLKGFSAIGYFFGKYLQRKLNVPIGLVHSSWGGTPAEVWTPRELIEEDDVLKQAAEKKPPVPWCPVQPGVVYNAMINPIKNYPISGAIWYQGESNTSTPGSYAKLLTTMIDAWRKDWHTDFPFYLVQIAPYTYGNNLSAAVLREQQTIAAKHYRSGMIVISDLVSDTTDIHPRDKKSVGKRLSDYVLFDHYKNGNEADAKSPVYESMVVNDGKAYINFNYAESGIVSRDKKINALLIAGTNKVFYPAEAKIEKGKLVAWSKNVKEPVAVRYQFCNACIGNLVSQTGLPVAPFRTDDWEVE